ncbi:glutamine synthetase beta-grasp domain-containing protein, partial [bacterium]|nr:glutamine synthetase beta-grasp domain-containing protein [bacterium]
MIWDNNKIYDFNPEEVIKCNSSEDVLKLLKNNKEIQFVRIFFSDLLGNIQSDFAVPRYMIDKKSLEEGFWYDGSSVLGQARINESDKIAVPIPETAVITPWAYSLKTQGLEDKKWRELIMFAKIYNPNGTRYEGDVRYVLEKTISKAKRLLGANYFYVGPELEFFLFKANSHGRPEIVDGKPVLVDYGSYFKGGCYGAIRKESQLILQNMGF